MINQLYFERQYEEPIAYMDLKCKGTPLEAEKRRMLNAREHNEEKRRRREEYKPLPKTVDFILGCV